MQVKSIAECILQYFRPSLSYQLSLRPLFCLFLNGGFTVFGIGEGPDQIFDLKLHYMNVHAHFIYFPASGNICHLLIIFANSLDPE